MHYAVGWRRTVVHPALDGRAEVGQFLIVAELKGKILKYLREDRAHFHLRKVLPDAVPWCMSKR